MEFFGQLRVSFWIVIAGLISLYAFFVALAGVSPSQVIGVTVVVGALAAVFMLRNLRLASELSDRGGDPRLRRSLNRMRERRGF